MEVTNRFKGLDTVTDELWMEVCDTVQEAMTKSMDWFQTGKGVHQGCILSPYLLNLCVENIMQNARLDEA